MTRLLSVKQAVPVFGMTEYAIRKAISDGLMPWVPVGDRPQVKLPDNALDEYMRRVKVAADPNALITTRRKNRTRR